MVFQLWDAVATFGYLNLRSATLTEAGEHSNIDIVFNGVEYVELAEYLHGLSFDNPTPDEVAYISRRCEGVDRGGSKYVIVSNQRRYYVVALGVSVDENNLPFGVSAIDRYFDLTKGEPERLFQ